MPRAKASLSQSELTRYAKAMRAAGFDDLRMVIEKPYGNQGIHHSRRGAPR